MNLSTKQRFPNDEDVSVPLNLSVKKTSTATSSSAGDSSKLFVPPKLSVNSNNVIASNRQALSHPFLNHGQQANFSAPLIQPQKKRGRKPKALLNNSSGSSNNLNNTNNINNLNFNNEAIQQQLLNFPGFAQMASNFLANSGGLGGQTGASTHTATATSQNASGEGKPRKRGRPPTLSPPHNSLQPMAAHGTGQQAGSGKANSTSAFAASSNYPFNLFNLNTPNDLMAGWPGLNALTAAAAAAAAAASGNPFSNSQNPFNIFKQLNQKDINNFNLNLMNSNLFNFKNLPPSSQESQHEFTNNKAPKTERRSKVDDVPFSQSSLPKNATNSFSSKTFAHKPHPNEKQLRIPLNHGWKRYTYISSISKVGLIEGEVYYIAPCGKKMRNFPELIKYLTKNAIASMTRDNFSFDTNSVVGQFLQMIPGYNSEILLNESQMKAQLEEIRQRNFSMPSSSNSQSNNVPPEKKRRVRDSSGSRNVYDSVKNFKSPVQQNKTAFDGISGRNDFEPSITITLQNAQSQKGFKRKSLEQNKADLLRVEKMMKKQEEERIQRELKEKQDEERKQKEAIELQKQEELKIQAEIERERANQHQMLINALAEIKASEEREIKKKRMDLENDALQERKTIKKYIELELIKEMKKPIEDMMLKDLRDLPTFNRIPGLKLSGKAFADSLMVFEFLYNFGETIGFDTDSLPNLNTLMMALLNLDQEAEDELLSIIVHLVVCAIEDPGMPTNMTTALGQKLKDANVTPHNLTEILRLYFYSFSSVVNEADKYRRVEYRLFEQLDVGIPFISLNATVKLDILVFLCNELLCNQAIVKQIDENIESVTSFKKDKWAVENDIRKLRLVKMRRERIAELENAKKEAAENEAAAAAAAAAASTSALDSTADSDAEETTSTVVAAPTLVIQESFEDDISMTNEEIDKKIDRLNRNMNTMNNKLNRALNSYRVFPLGQDRYRRTLWVLPNCGGVFVEAMESGDPDEIEANTVDKDEENAVKSLENGDAQEIDHKISIKNEPLENGQAKLDNDDDNSNSSSDTKELKIEEPKEENEKSSDDVSELKHKDDPLTKENHENDDKEKIKLENGHDSAENNSDEASEKPIKEENGEVKKEDEPEEDNMKWFDLILDCEQAHTKDDTDKFEEIDEDDYEELSTPSDKDSELYRKLEKGLGTFLDDATMECLFGHADQNEDAAILKETFIRIVANFPKSALFTDFTHTEISESETIVCQNLQKRIQSWKEFHHGVPLKIGREHQLGWWRITDPTQLKSLVELYHGNAARESKLQKHLEKHLNYAMQSCKVSAANLEVNDYDRELSECREHGAPTQNKCPHKECFTKGYGYCIEVANIKDIQVLEVIEAFEEKVLSASMQIRSWKPSTQMTSADFRAKMISLTAGTSKNGKGGKSSKKQKVVAAALAAERNNAENNHSENGVFNDNLSLSNGNSQESGELTNDILSVQKEKLLEVEMIIERRYLKPPLGFKNSNMLANQASTSEMVNGDDPGEYSHEENAPAGLLRWRDAVMSSSCSSQVAMCLHFLENSIAWDKSIMRASCQFCGSGENEAHLLLCDLCDKGYHMYCFKPKMETVPAGDWFCFDCQNKNTIDKVCIVCGKKGKLLNCDTCAKAFHPNCLDPPINKQLKGKWVCHLCQRKNKRFSGTSKSASKKSANASNPPVTNSDDTRPTDSPSSTPNSKESKRISNGNGKEKSEKTKKERKVKPKEDKVDKEKSIQEDERTKVEVAKVVPEMSNELEKCRQLMEGMISHESCWPFLEPVNTKQFPTYKKIIKRPMDLTVIKCKFESASYKSKEDFAVDIRLMFDNCVTFNEDESPVGQAGHNLRAFFETKWDEFFAGASL